MCCKCTKPPKSSISQKVFKPINRKSMQKIKINHLLISPTIHRADDRIYCGFVNVTKDGPDKYFNLRCFYCDAEYPISFYSDFSDHINENHGSFEKVHVNQEHGDLEKFHVDNNANTTTNEMVFSDFSDSSDEMPQEEQPPKRLFTDLIDTGAKETYIPSLRKKKELLPDDFDDGEESETASESEAHFMCVENYDPNFDHCYSQGFSNVTKNFILSY